MASTVYFTPAQKRILQDTAKRVRRKFKNQQEMALALGITQQSIGNIIKGTYAPGAKVAMGLAELDGKTLESLIGPYGDASVPRAPGSRPFIHEPRYVNLEACINFYRTEKQWKAWTLAAARAGAFGDDDFRPAEWHDKLDALEKALEKAIGALSSHRK